MNFYKNLNKIRNWVPDSSLDNVLKSHQRPKRLVEKMTKDQIKVTQSLTFYLRKLENSNNQTKY